jgi:hypothetical protein
VPRIPMVTLILLIFVYLLDSKDLLFTFERFIKKKRKHKGRWSVEPDTGDDREDPIECKLGNCKVFCSLRCPTPDPIQFFSFLHAHSPSCSYWALSCVGGSFSSGPYVFTESGFDIIFGSFFLRKLFWVTICRLSTVIHNLLPF